MAVFTRAGIWLKGLNLGIVGYIWVFCGFFYDYFDCASRVYSNISKASL